MQKCSFYSYLLAPLIIRQIGYSESKLNSRHKNYDTGKRIFDNAKSFSLKSFYVFTEITQSPGDFKNKI